MEKKEFELALQANPYTAQDKKTIHFYFCHKKPILDKEKLKSFIADNEICKLQDKVFYLYAPYGIGHSKLVKNIELCLGVSATGRNLNTVLKLQSMLKDI